MSVDLANFKDKIIVWVFIFLTEFLFFQPCYNVQNYVVLVGISLIFFCRSTYVTCTVMYTHESTGRYTVPNAHTRILHETEMI